MECLQEEQKASDATDDKGRPEAAPGLTELETQPEHMAWVVPSQTERERRRTDTAVEIGNCWNMY